MVFEPDGYWRKQLKVFLFYLKKNSVLYHTQSSKMGLSLHHKANLSCCFSISRFLQPPNSSLPFSRAKNVSPLSHALKDEFYNAVVCQYEIDSVSSLRFCPGYQIVTATYSGDDCWLTAPSNNSAGIVERVTQLRCTVLHHCNQVILKSVGIYCQEEDFQGTRSGD